LTTSKGIKNIIDCQQTNDLGSTGMDDNETTQSPVDLSKKTKYKNRRYNNSTHSTSIMVEGDSSMNVYDNINKKEKVRRCKNNVSVNIIDVK